MNNSLRLLFNSLKVNNNIQLLLKLANFGIKYFEQYDSKNDEFTKMIIGSTLKLIQKEYIDKLDMEYQAKIFECNNCEIYNAINDADNKIIIDFGTYEEFYKLHMKEAINIDISNEINDKSIFDILFKHIKTRTNPKIYAYFRNNNNNHPMTDEFKMDENNHCIQLLERIQKSIWQNIMTIIPIYIYKHSFDIFSVEYYPFLCAQGIRKRYVGCDREFHIDYPNQIIDNKLFLGNIKHATNDEILTNLNITHIVNVTGIDYDNEITKHKQRYIQIQINDHYYEQIDTHFDKVHQFIQEALNTEGNKLLIHCRAGVSRSATMIISYLIKIQKLNLKDALNLVKSKRSKIQPNDGFMQQLKMYQQSLNKTF